MSGILLLCLVAQQPMQPPEPVQPVSTFSIVARDPVTGGLKGADIAPAFRTLLGG